MYIYEGLRTLFILGSHTVGHSASLQHTMDPTANAQKESYIKCLVTILVRSMLTINCL